MPFTPVPGRRLLVRADVDGAYYTNVLASAAAALCDRLGASSVHVTFLSEREWKALGCARLPVAQRPAVPLAQRRLRDVRGFPRQPRLAQAQGGAQGARAGAASGDIVIERLTGADIKEKHWDAFFDFYTDTGSRKWGQPYLNRRFFSLLGASMADRCLLIMAKRGRRYVAGALNLIGGDCLYGRYWGALEQHPCLHFEVCYYQAIDYAIAHGLARVEAGAQGEHKLARGYMPTPTYSAHWIADPGLRRAIARYLQDERAAVAESIAELAAFGPYRKDVLNLTLLDGATWRTV